MLIYILFILRCRFETLLVRTPHDEMSPGSKLKQSSCRTSDSLKMEAEIESWLEHQVLSAVDYSIPCSASALLNLLLDDYFDIFCLQGANRLYKYTITYSWIFPLEIMIKMSSDAPLTPLSWNTQQLWILRLIELLIQHCNSICSRWLVGWPVAKKRPIEEI